MSSSLKLPMSCEDHHSETIEVNVKDELNSIEDEFIPYICPTETTFNVSDIEIKLEDIGYGFNNNTYTSDAEDNSEPRPKTVSIVQHVDCSSVKTEEEHNDLSELYVDLLKCEKGCGTCLKYMRILSKHVRATHVPPQAIQDPLHIDPPNIESYPPQAEESSSVQIKCEVDEDIDKMDYSEEETKSTPEYDSDPAFASETVSECDTDYSPSPRLTRNVHKRTHTEKKTFKCDECDRSFSRSDRLTEHKRIHTREKPFKCDDCEMSFHSKTILTGHRKTHTGKTPYECAPCEKSFTSSSGLTQHMRIHTGLKPFNCDMCEKSFIIIGQLTRHKKVHAGIKPFKCDLCEKCFTESGNLTKHKRVHTGVKPFKCDVCEKSFRGSDQLSRHKRTHTGVKPYMCDDCGNCFSMPHHLVIHKRIHTGEKPWKCNECGKSFSNNRNLIGHKRIHTRGKSGSHRQANRQEKSLEKHRASVV